MRKLIIFSVAISVFLFSQDIAAQSSTYRSSIDSVIALLKTEALLGKKLNADPLKGELYYLADEATSYGELKPAIDKIVAALKDPQASFLSPSEADSKQYTDSEISNTEALVCFRIPKKNISVLQIPSPDRISGNYSDVIRKMIDSLSYNDSTHWIVDVRGLKDIKLEELLTGTGPVLGEGLIGSTSDRNNSVLQLLEIHNGKFYRDQQLVKLYKQPTELVKSKFALLTDGQTSGAAEIFAWFFKARKNVRTFGTPTAGQGSLTKIVNIAGGKLTFSTMGFTDRRGNIYKGRIQPDEIITDGNDEVMRRAIEWLTDKPQSTLSVTASR